MKSNEFEYDGEMVEFKNLPLAIQQAVMLKEAALAERLEAHLRPWRHNNTKIRYKRRESRLARRKR